MKLGLLEIHCLQFSDDLQQIKPWLHEESVFNWTDRLRDFSDTAHIIRQLDLVVCVDTAVAHLAGAMNRPTWLLLPYNADFRWLRARSDSPWYPSMRLFRQTARNDWSSVAQQLNTAFDELFNLDLQALTDAKNLK